MRLSGFIRGCLTVGLCLLLSAGVCAQKSVRVVFYNLENCFDCIDDEGKNDGQFTPEGDYHWTEKRYQTKLRHLSQALAAAGQDGFPDIVGMAEIENEGVLQQLLRTANMSRDYRYVYHESPDKRGIDVCFVYNRFRFRLLETHWFAVYPKGSRHSSRDILYVKGRLADRRDIHFFVCHWPSRYGGAKESEPGRFQAAQVVKFRTDSIMAADSRARILIMGDFNDEPTDLSLMRELQARPDTCRCRPAELYNLMWQLAVSDQKPKSYKYQGRWSELDQIIVSSALYRSPELRPRSGVLAKDFLLTEDTRYMGVKPFRTYNGRSWLGGYSDHLPVWADIPLSPAE